MEIPVAGGFAIAAVVGFRKGLWVVAAALLIHGVIDLVHHRLVYNPGVPALWSGFCLAIDAGLAAVLMRKRGRVLP